MAVVACRCDAAARERVGTVNMLKADDIVRQSMRSRSKDADGFVHSMAQYMKDSGAFAVQVKDTIFLLEPRPEKGVEIHVFSAEKSHHDLAEDIILLSGELKDAGYTHWYGETDEPALVKVADLTHLPLKKTPVTLQNGKSGTRFTLELS